jgi:hypothetical protein
MRKAIVAAGIGAILGGTAGLTLGVVGGGAIGTEKWELIYWNPRH